MNPTKWEINELLAIKHGWQKINIPNHQGLYETRSPWQKPKGYTGPNKVPPDYSHDLNVVHELENFFLDRDIYDPDSPRYAYSRVVYKMCVPDIQPFRAPASIRAEALARVFFPEKFDS